MTRRAYWLALFLALLALPAAAQNSTVVTGTITDPNGITWQGATIQAQMIPVNVTPQVPPPCNGQSAVPCVCGARQRGNADVPERSP